MTPNSETELSRVTDRLTNWQTDTAHISNNNLHLTYSTQPKNEFIFYCIEQNGYTAYMQKQ